MSRTTCASCGRGLPEGKRKWCDETCRKRGQRGGEVRDLEQPESVVAVTRSTLSTAGRLATPRGAAALVIATKLDAGGDTGSAVASLVRELRATLDEALADAKVEADPVDELGRKRALRLASA